MFNKKNVNIHFKQSISVKMIIQKSAVQRGRDKFAYGRGNTVEDWKHKRTEIKNQVS